MCMTCTNYLEEEEEEEEEEWVSAVALQMHACF